MMLFMKRSVSSGRNEVASMSFRNPFVLSITEVIGNPDGDCDGVPVNEGDCDGVPDIVLVPLRVVDGVGDTVRVSEGDCDRDAVALLVSVAVTEAVFDELGLEL